MVPALRPCSSRRRVVDAFWALVAIGIAGCGSDQDRSFLYVELVTRDGEDPFVGATTVQVTLEGEEPIAYGPVPIDPAGGFVVDVDVSDSQAAGVTRVRLEALDAAGDLVSRGSTPIAPIGVLSGFTIRLLISPPGSAGSLTIPGLPALASAVRLFDQWILGLDETGALVMLDLLTYLPVPGVAPLDPPRPGARMVDLGGGRTLILGGGGDPVVFDGSTNEPTDTDDGLETATWGFPTAVALQEGGAVVLCDGSGDIVVFDAEGGVASNASLTVDRTACAAAVVGDRLVVYGGGTDADPSAEIVELQSGEVTILATESDSRRRAAAVALGERVFVVGGVSSGEEPRALGDGVVLDLSCDDSRPGDEDSCKEPFALGAPRDTPVAVALDAEILVASDGTAERIAADSLTTQPVVLPRFESGAISAVLLLSTEDAWFLGGALPIVFSAR